MHSSLLLPALALTSAFGTIALGVRDADARLSSSEMAEPVIVHEGAASVFHAAAESPWRAFSEGGAGQRGGLATSVAGGGEPRPDCSVLSGTGTPFPRCTTQSGTWCSAYCQGTVDSEGTQQCSVWANGDSGHKGACSVRGSTTDSQCSIEYDRSEVNDSPSECSVFHDSGDPDFVKCSIWGDNADGKACSAFNPNVSFIQGGHECSVIESSGTTDSEQSFECSVFADGDDHECSTFDAVAIKSSPKSCSVFTNESQCSVEDQSGWGGTCTIFGSPGGTCSIQAGTANHCSVMDTTTLPDMSGQCTSP